MLEATSLQGSESAEFGQRNAESPLPTQPHLPAAGKDDGDVDEDVDDAEAAVAENNCQHSVCNTAGLVVMVMPTHMTVELVPLLLMLRMLRLLMIMMTTMMRMRMLVLMMLARMTMMTLMRSLVTVISDAEAADDNDDDDDGGEVVDDDDDGGDDDDDGDAADDDDDDNDDVVDVVMLVTISCDDADDGVNKEAHVYVDTNEHVCNEALSVYLRARTHNATQLQVHLSVALQ